jgi:hypothetical protein
MKLFTKEILEKLRENAKTQPKNPRPVVKLFTPWTGCTWLLAELDEENIAYGLCDLGQGYPELGYVSIDEIVELRGPAGLKIERDLHFTAKKTLTEYADEAREKGQIVT